MPCWEFKKAINLKSMLLPYHPGTIRYLKEKGLWSKEMEKRQNQLIQEQTSMKKLWDAIIIEAKTKNIDCNKNTLPTDTPLVALSVFH